jgi:hypothetical protein
VEEREKAAERARVEEDAARRAAPAAAGPSASSELMSSSSPDREDSSSASSNAPWELAQEESLSSIVPRLGRTMSYNFFQI